MDGTTAIAVYGDVTVPFFSIGTTALILFIVLPLAAFLGFAVGRAQRRRMTARGEEADLAGGDVTTGAVLALLGLLLAFSFGHSMSLAETRKSAIIVEANALGTAFLRADYVAEPSRSALQRAIYDYARTRVTPGDGQLSGRDALLAFLDRSLEAQGKLWPLTLEATADPLPPPMKGFVAGSVNAVLDAHNERLRTLKAPVAQISQLMVLSAAVAALYLLGNRSAMAGRMLSWRTFVFSGLLVVVMLTIIDVQRPGEGLARVDLTPLRAVIFDMENSLG